MSIRRLEWDSRFFGYPVAVASCDPARNPHDLPSMLREARDANIRLLYLFTPPLHADLRSTLRQAGAKDLGRKIEYAKTLRHAPPADATSGIFLCRVNSDRLEHLALESGIHSRFRLDNQFQNREFERLYREWLARSLRGDNGWRAYVGGSVAAPRGLITVEPGDPARIGLMAVADDCRGQGMGRKLLAAAEGSCFHAPSIDLHIATQSGNPEARRLYQACGFKKISEIECFHIWLPSTT